MQRLHSFFVGLALGASLLVPTVARAADDGSRAATSPMDAAPTAGAEAGRLRLEPAVGFRAAALSFDSVTRAAPFVDGDLAFRFGSSTYRPSLGAALGSIITGRSAVATALLDVCPIGVRFANERVRLSACFVGGVGTAGSASPVGPVWTYGGELRSRFYVGKLVSSSGAPSAVFYADLGLGWMGTRFGTTNAPTIGGETSPSPDQSSVSSPLSTSALLTSFAFGVELR